MKEKNDTTIHSAVINRAISYIFDHVDEDISVDDVAKHCSYSKYHLMRLFRENMDEALYQFIKRVRLERSAWKLKVEKERSVTEIGIEYGYSSSNFATAFRKHLNTSPTDFRKASEQLVEQSSFAHGISLDEIEDAGGKSRLSIWSPCWWFMSGKKVIIITFRLSGVHLSKNIRI